jgi:hypothetical protein
MWIQAQSSPHVEQDTSMVQISLMAKFRIWVGRGLVQSTPDPCRMMMKSSDSTRGRNHFPHAAHHKRDEVSHRASAACHPPAHCRCFRGSSICEGADAVKHLTGHHDDVQGGTRSFRRHCRWQHPLSYPSPSIFLSQLASCSAHLRYQSPSIFLSRTASCCPDAPFRFRFALSAAP